jgi:hypothetical protein
MTWRGRSEVRFRTKIIDRAINKLQRARRGKGPRVFSSLGPNAMRTESIIFGFIALTSALILSGLFLILPSP